MRVERVGAFVLGWGESLVWDERRSRLYFVDCADSTLQWLDAGSEAPESMTMPSMPTGVVPTEDGRLAVMLADGVHLVDPDRRITRLLTAYPDGLGGRANDACADLAGNLVTGTLNLGPAEGSAWWYSPTAGWRLLDPDISNTNGPQVVDTGRSPMLIVGDTSAHYFAYDYDPTAGTATSRRIHGDVSGVAGAPDGTTVDREGGLWCALFGGGHLARYTAEGLDVTIPVPVANPTDVTFGGEGLDRLYVTSVAAAPAAGGDGLDGALLVIEGLAHTGRPEPRFAAPAAAADT